MKILKSITYLKGTLELGLAAVSMSPSRPRVCVAAVAASLECLGVAAKRGARSGGLLEPLHVTQQTTRSLSSLLLPLTRSCAEYNIS